MSVWLVFLRRIDMLSTDNSYKRIYIYSPLVLFSLYSISGRLICFGFFHCYSWFAGSSGSGILNRSSIVIVIVIVIVVVVIIVVSIILVRTLDPFKGYNRFYLVCMGKYIHARRLKEKKGKEIISGESKER